jgi:hypothetical protein
MDLQTERTGGAEASGAPEALKGDVGPRRSQKGKAHGVRHAQRLERGPHRALDGRAREAIQRIWQAVVSLGRLAGEASEEERPARADDQRGAPSGNERLEAQRRGHRRARGVERSRVDR